MQRGELRVAGEAGHEGRGGVEGGRGVWDLTGLMLGTRRLLAGEEGVRAQNRPSVVLV